MAEAETAVHYLEAVEATPNQREQSGAERVDEGDGMEIVSKRTRPLVECRGRAYAHCLSEVLLRQTGAGLDHGPVSPARIYFMNRRVRNRTHGGVGGRREQSRLLPDS